MSTLVVLTVVEIVVLVAGLALFLIALTRRLRAVADILGQISAGSLSAIHGKVCLVGAGAAILNRQLDAIASMLPAVTEKAESLGTQPSSGTQSSSSGRDPMIGRR